MKDDDARLALAAEITAAWLGNPNTRASADDVLSFLRSTFAAVTSLATPAATAPEEAPEPDYTPAVSVRKSLANPDHIISMIDGKPYKTLRRHLATQGLTPDEYRQRYGLKSDYPMTAANYSEARRAMAKRIGLGRKPVRADTSTVSTSEKVQAAEPAAPKRARRKSGAQALGAAKARFGGEQS